MAVNTELLATYGVKQSLIKLLIIQFEDALPYLPIELLENQDDDNSDYFGLNEYYALKLLQAQGSRPSGSGVHKLIGGKTADVFKRVKEVKERIGDAEFKPYQTNNDDPLVAIKKQLLKTEIGVWENKLDAMEIAHERAIELIEAKYTATIREQEKELHTAREVSQHYARENKSANEKIESLIQQLAQNESLQSINKSLQNQLDLLSHQIVEKNAEIKSLNEAYQHLKEAESTRYSDLSFLLKKAESRSEVFKRDLDEREGFIQRYLKEREVFQAQISELKLEQLQNKLSLAADDAQSRLASNIDERLNEFKVLTDLVSELSKITKKGSFDTKTLEAAINDLSSNFLTLKTKIVAN